MVNNVQYNAASQVTALNYYGTAETRQYNNLLQLTNISAGSAINITYNYTPGGDSGKITSSYDAISGEAVVYQYDALNRLISAQGTGWAQTQAYDGFGSLTSRVGYGTAQSTTISTPVNAATNQLSGYSYDANGNLISTGYSYDAENRIEFANAGGVQYFYDAQNKRIWQGNCTTSGYCSPGTGWVLNAEQVNMYGADGKMIGTYSLFSATTTERIYFGGRLVAQQSVNQGAPVPIVQDRLGSVGKYYPYGEERNSPQLPNDQVKFATYTRDSATGNDYADQRYYTSTLGRFMTPDRYWGSASPGNPQSWNRYTYVLNDPVNRNDPLGLCDDVISGIGSTSTDNSTAGFATGIGAMQAYPYAGTDWISGAAEVALGGVTASTWNAATVAASIIAAANDSSDPINLFIFSGGAQAFADALAGGLLPASVIDRISSITYASPGMVGTPATVNGITPTVVLGQGGFDDLATAGTVIPSNWTVIQTQCGHDASCEFAAAVAAGVKPGDPCNQPAAISSPLQPGALQALANLTSLQVFNPFWYLNAMGPVQMPDITFVFSTVGFPSAEPVGCVTTPGLNGGPPETVCQ